MSSFGTWLARERELRGITLAEVSEATKIPRTTLEAIEADDTLQRPGRTYLVGTLRSVADVLGLDPDEVVLRYEEAEGPFGESREERSGRGAPPRWARWIVSAMVAVLLVGAGLLAWFLLR